MNIARKKSIPGGKNAKTEEKNLARWKEKLLSYKSKIHEDINELSSEDEQ